MKSQTKAFEILVTWRCSIHELKAEPKTSLGNPWDKLSRQAEGKKFVELVPKKDSCQNKLSHRHSFIFYPTSLIKTKFSFKNLIIITK